MTILTLCSLSCDNEKYQQLTIEYFEENELNISRTYFSHHFPKAFLFYQLTKDEDIVVGKWLTIVNAQNSTFIFYPNKVVVFRFLRELDDNYEIFTMAGIWKIENSILKITVSKAYQQQNDELTHRAIQSFDVNLIAIADFSTDGFSIKPFNLIPVPSELGIYESQVFEFGKVAPAYRYFGEYLVVNNKTDYSGSGFACIEALMENNVTAEMMMENPDILYACISGKATW
jgi:hypothetical protein